MAPRTGCTGAGTPRYLATIDTNKTLTQNVVRSVLSPNGNVRIQVETAIAQEHRLRELSEYNAILSAIGPVGRMAHLPAAQIDS
jgi:hypothetical protein